MNVQPIRPTPQPFYATNHYDRLCPTHHSLWRPARGNRYIGTVYGMAKEIELTLVPGLLPKRGSFIQENGVRSILQVGPLPLPRSMTILSNDDRYGVLMIPLHGNPREIETQELLATVTLMTTDKEEAIWEAVRYMLGYHHIVVFNFTKNHLPRPRRPSPDLLAA